MSFREEIRTILDTIELDKRYFYRVPDEEEQYGYLPLIDSFPLVRGFELFGFYFVKDMILEKGGIINIVCEEDVRYTWRKEIRAQQFLIARQEFINNKVIHDDRCVMPLTRQIDTVKIGDVGDDEGDGSIILTVSGRKFNIH